MSEATWAELTLADAGLPVTVSNVQNFERWMTAEEPTSTWWWGNDPLNATLDATYKGGQYAYVYPDLTTAAEYTAAMIDQPNMGGIKTAFAKGNASTAEIGAAIEASPWAASHYGHNPNFLNQIPVPKGGMGGTLLAPNKTQQSGGGGSSWTSVFGDVGGFFASIPGDLANGLSDVANFTFGWVWTLVMRLVLTFVFLVAAWLLLNHAIGGRPDRVIGSGLGGGLKALRDAFFL